VIVNGKSTSATLWGNTHVCVSLCLLLRRCHGHRSHSAGGAAARAPTAGVCIRCMLCVCVCRVHIRRVPSVCVSFPAAVQIILQEVLKRGARLLVCAASNIAVDNLVERVARHKASGGAPGPPCAPAAFRSGCVPGCPGMPLSPTSGPRPLATWWLASIYHSVHPLYSTIPTSDSVDCHCRYRTVNLVCVTVHVQNRQPCLCHCTGPEGGQLCT